MPCSPENGALLPFLLELKEHGKGSRSLWTLANRVPVAQSADTDLGAGVGASAEGRQATLSFPSFSIRLFFFHMIKPVTMTSHLTLVCLGVWFVCLFAVVWQGLGVRRWTGSCYIV